MGSGLFSSRSYDQYAARASTMSRKEIFQQNRCHPSMSPRDVNIRESRDSDDHPMSTPVIIALDVTGSMGMISENLVKSGLGSLMNGILETKPVSDPQIMIMGVGDIACDSTPLQVSQFESDNRIVTELEKLYLEGGGGGNGVESYDLPWQFAAAHTDCDSWNIRGERGYLFTIGDECFPRGWTQSQLKDRVMGSTAGEINGAEKALAAAQEKWKCFHLIIEQGHYFQYSNPRAALSSWREVLGKRAILVDDYQNLPEIVVAIMRVDNGENPEVIIEESSPSVARSIQHALYE